MAEARGAAEASQRIADLFEREKISYAIGGAPALAVAGVPRGTAYVDVNVFVDDAQLPNVLTHLESLGMEVDREASTARARRDGMFIAGWDGMRIDCSLPSIPFAREAEHTRIRIVDDAGWSGWFLSAEALTVFKLLFFRGKDLVDLERLIAARPDLDRAYVRAKIVEMMGDDDERVKRWDDLVRRFG